MTPCRRRGCSWARPNASRWPVASPASGRATPSAWPAAHQAIEEAFPGRFVLGLGVSHAPMVEFVHQQAYDKPYSAMVAYLDAMDASDYMSPKAARRRPAGCSPRSATGCWRWRPTKANGAHPYLVTPEHTAHAREVMGEGPLLVPELRAYLGSARRGPRGRTRELRDLQHAAELPEQPAAAGLRRRRLLRQRVGPPDRRARRPRHRRRHPRPRPAALGRRRRQRRGAADQRRARPRHRSSSGASSLPRLTGS